MPLASLKNKAIPMVKAIRKRPSRSRHHFVLAAMKAPLKIGGFLPSSRSLAKAMADGAVLEREGIILELGAGTGVVTHALLNRQVPAERLIVVERDEKLYNVITKHYPHVNILQADAIKLDEVLKEQGVEKVSTIVSSLPFLVMPKPVRAAIQEQMALAIGTHGSIVQFTYGPKSPISRHMMRKLNLKGKRVKLVIGNVPPAHVWHYWRTK